MYQISTKRRLAAQQSRHPSDRMTPLAALTLACFLFECEAEARLVIDWIKAEVS